MSPFRKKLAKKHNSLIIWILSIFGIACNNIACEYGTPEATFNISGTVRSAESHQPIGHIRVIMDRDTAYSTADGRYSVSVRSFPSSQTFNLGFFDSDGPANGAYQPKDSLVSFVEPEFKNGDNHWYSGETSKVIDIDLPTGSPAQPPFSPAP